jgi:predicted nucleic acid-binding protein
MPRINLFMDSSALFAGVISASGAARALLLLAETERITLTISEQVVTETERAIARKIPAALNNLRQTILTSKVEIIRSPSLADVIAQLDIIAHPSRYPDHSGGDASSRRLSGDVEQGAFYR